MRKIPSMISLSIILILFLFWLSSSQASAQEAGHESPLNPQTAATCPITPYPAALLAGDSWAQFMWDDDSHNDIFDKFGHPDKQMISRSLAEDPGPSYSGPQYAISGSEARQWVDTQNYPWMANMVADLQANPTISTVVLSIGGNDVLAAKSGGGWYKDMDLDQPGSEQALFNQIEADTMQIVNTIQDVRPDMQVLLSSYDYPNFNTGIWCFAYACPKREDLSRDPANDLISDEELNSLMINVEGRRIAWVNAHDRLHYDNSIGLMHYFYGDGLNPPGTLPYPGQTPPGYLPFPGGNPLRPTLRENFRPFSGFIDGDPIHLDYDGYQYKISNQTLNYFFPRFRDQQRATFFSLGGVEDGWTDGTLTGNESVSVGSVGGSARSGIVSLDTSGLPDDAVITGATLYLMRQNSSGISPFQSGVLGAPVVDVASGSFGGPAIEPGDANAPSDAANAGCTAGSAGQDDYAIRINLTEAGMAAINRSGRTQVRISFSNPTAADNAAVHFNSGDDLLPTGRDRLVLRTEKVLQRQPDGRVLEVLQTVLAIEHQGLAEYMGSPRPFLDVSYCLPGEADCTSTQEISLAGGWNMISSYVEPANADITVVLAPIEDDLLLVKNGDGLVYWPGQSINSLGQLNVRDGYQIFMNNPVILPLSGQQVDPAQIAIELSAGWHTVAYLRNAPLGPDLALSSIGGQLYLLKDGLGNLYWPEFGIDQIKALQPGQGYQIYMSESGTLVYPEN